HRRPVLPDQPGGQRGARSRAALCTAERLLAGHSTLWLACQPAGADRPPGAADHRRRAALLQPELDRVAALVRGPDRPDRPGLGWRSALSLPAADGAAAAPDLGVGPRGLLDRDQLCRLYAVAAGHGDSPGPRRSAAGRASVADLLLDVGDVRDDRTARGADSQGRDRAGAAAEVS